MMKSKLSLARVATVMAALIIGAALAAPFYFSRWEQGPDNKVLRLIKSHDLAQHRVMMEEFDKVLRSGVFYPRWFPDINNGYGNAWGNYYPPGFYYSSALVNSVMNDWVNTLFVISALGFGLSGLAFYWLSRTFYGKAASVIASLFYMTLPFHVINLYWQGALPQFLGYILLPLITYFTLKLGAHGQARYYAGLGLFYGLYLVTHFPVAYLFTYALALYTVIWTIKERNLKIAFRIGGGILLGLILSAIYLAPAVLERGAATEIHLAIFPYHESYQTLRPGIDAFDELMRQIFALHAVTLLIAIVILFVMRGLTKRRREEQERSGAESQTGAGYWWQARMWMIVAVAITFMITPFSKYISKLIPKIEIVLFAWRWLPIASLFMALLVAAVIERLSDRDKRASIRIWSCRAAIGAAMILNVWLTAQAVIIGALSHPSIDVPDKYMEQATTPAGSIDPRDLPDTPLATIQPESGTVEVVRWEPQFREIRVTAEQASVLRLKTYEFPGWTARIDGDLVPIYGDALKVQTLMINPGNHRVEVSFESTPARVFGTAISGVGLLIVLGLALTHRLQKRRIAEEKSLDVKENKQPGLESPKTDEVAFVSGRRTIIAAVALASIITIFIAVMVIRNSESAPVPSDDTLAQTATPDASNAPPTSNNNLAQTETSDSIRAERRLFIDGASAIRVAVDEKAFDELIGALVSRNGGKLQALIRDGKVFSVQNKTRVEVIDRGSAKLKIRILEGGNTAKEGWIMDRWIE